MISNEKTLITLVVKKETLERIKKQADKEELTQSAFIRKVILQYLTEQELK